MKLTKTEQIVFDWYMFMKPPKAELKKLVNRLKLMRLKENEMS